MIRAIGRQPIIEEFLNTAIGDQRLTRRLAHLAELLDGKFASNIPQACVSWKEIMAAYRFFSNDRIAPESIQITHFANTIMRINDFKDDTVIIVQDSTSFNFRHHPATLNLGPIGNYSHKDLSRGIWCHVAMVYTVHGTPLGILMQKFWIRKKKTKSQRSIGKNKLQRRPITKKESFRWLQGFDFTWTVQQQTQKRMITVTDAEGDIGELLGLAIDRNAGFIIRTDDLRTCVEAESKSIKKYLKLSHFNDTMVIKVVSRNKISRNFGKAKRDSPKRRDAIIRIWWKEITLDLKRSFAGTHDRKKLHVVLADEELPLGSKVNEPLCWILLTNEKVGSTDDAKRIIQLYKTRWQVEEYWRIYKTGCKVRDCRLGYGQRLIRYLKIMGVIAWRQHYLTEIGREYPDLPASVCLTPAEIQSLAIEFINVEPTTLTLGEAWRLIAQLGGYFNRKSDSSPGATTFWRGLQQIFYTSRGVEQATKQLNQSVSKSIKAA